MDPAATAFDLPRSDGEIFLMKKNGTAPKPVATAVKSAYKKTLVMGRESISQIVKKIND